MKRACAIVVIALVIPGCGLVSSNSDCGSSNARDMVLEIARTSAMLLRSIKITGEGAANPRVNDYSNNEEVKIILQKIDEYDSEIKKKTNECLEMTYDPQMTQQFEMKYQAENQAKDPLEILDIVSRHKRFCTDYRYNIFDPEYSDIPEFIFAQKYLVQSAELVDKLKKELDVTKEKIFDKAFLNASRNGFYKLNNIIPLSRNNSTGSVMCKAELSASVPDWGEAYQPIEFSVEKTTEGKLYVEVFTG